MNDDVTRGGASVLLQLKGPNGERLFAPVPDSCEDLRKLLASLLLVKDVHVSIINARQVPSMKDRGAA